jgi:hypothetical protein
MCKKDKTQVKQTYEVFSYIQYVTTLFDRACMHRNISYINTCKLKKNRERRKELVTFTLIYSRYIMFEVQIPAFTTLAQQYTTVCSLVSRGLKLIIVHYRKCLVFDE